MSFAADTEGDGSSSVASDGRRVKVRRVKCLRAYGLRRGSRGPFDRLRAGSSTPTTQSLRSWLVSAQDDTVVIGQSLLADYSQAHAS